MIIGAVVGGVVGALAAYAYIESQRTGGLFVTKRERGRDLRVQAGTLDYVRIGAAVYALARQIQAMLKPV
jgi:hypothetical protein